MHFGKYLFWTSKYFRQFCVAVETVLCLFLQPGGLLETSSGWQWHTAHVPVTNVGKSKQTAKLQKLEVQNRIVQ